VDDHRFLVTQLSRLLMEHGYEVTEAFDGFSAMELLRCGDFDYLIADHYMPGYSGLELVDFVCAKSADTGIILITSDYGNKETLDRVRIYPRASVMIKPVTGTKLLSELTLLSKKAAGERSGGNPVHLPEVLS